MYEKRQREEQRIHIKTRRKQRERKQEIEEEKRVENLEGKINREEVKTARLCESVKM